MRETAPIQGPSAPYALRNSWMDRTCGSFHALMNSTRSVWIPGFFSIVHVLSACTTSWELRQLPGSPSKTESHQTHSATRVFCPRPNSGLHVFQQHSVPFALRHYYPEVPARQFPLPSHFGSPPSVDPQMIHCLPNRPLGAEPTLCGYRLPERQLSGPYRTNANCRSAGHLSLAYPRRPPCHRYRPNCPVPRATSNLRLNMAGEGTGRPKAKGQQDDGSCSGGSYRTERSGYFPDGPASDSSSGPCHGSSSDSALNFTDVSLQGMYGSCSTFRSSLSSDYDPLVYYGPGPHRRECLDTDSRPHSLDSMNRGCPEEPLFSHVHCHRHRHPHCSDVDHSLGPDWASDDEQSSIPHLSTDRYSPPRHCSDPEPLDRLPSQREELKLINPSQSSFVLPPPPTEA
ncbi:hypothetical protein GJAV_G00129360, partial [Gymnothorax javanicus]